MQLIHHHFKSIDSTNTWAKQHVKQFDPLALTLVTADAQTAGRGRLNRSWISPAQKNIYATYCLFLAENRKDIGNLPQVVALAALQVMALWNITGQLKWPNDLWIKQKKVGGLLSEAVVVLDKCCLLIGIGLNINMQPAELADIAKPATSLALETTSSIEVDQVLTLLTQQILSHSIRFLKEGFQPFLAPLQACLYRPETPISFHDNHQLHKGTIVGLNNDGSLTLRLEDGSTRVFYAGEII